MALQNDSGTREESVKSQFITREGTYKLMTLSEYSRPNRVPYNTQGTSNNNMGSSAPVRVSFLTIADDSQGCSDRICFNVGRELYVYNYRGVNKAADLARPIDKRVYKGTFPTCHDFNQELATNESCLLLVGFSAGQVQLIDPFRKELGVAKLFNEERLIDKTRVTCLHWLPGISKHFLVAYASGNVYLFNEELPCSVTAPSYQLFKQGDGYSVYTCKTKSTRNPMYKWSISDYGVNEFAFSPDHIYVAVVCQDGFLKIFNYDSMDLVGKMRSYFGGLLCVAWSPDGKYIVTGGEDDLVTVYSFLEKRVVCRGQGHKSWVSQVAFDPYTTNLGDLDLDLVGSEEDLQAASTNSHKNSYGDCQRLRNSFLNRSKKYSLSCQSLSAPACYRFGSVGHDTQLCLWDLTEDILKQPTGRVRTSTIFAQNSAPNMNFLSPIYGTNAVPGGSSVTTSVSPGSATSVSGGADGFYMTASTLPAKFGTLSVTGSNKDAANTTENNNSTTAKVHKKAFSLGGRNKHNHNANAVDKNNPGGCKDDAQKVFGTMLCPRIEDVPTIEPLITKKISHERLTVLAFREDSFVTACQEGFVCTWARPGRAGISHQHSINSPNPGSSPHYPSGTVV